MVGFTDCDFNQMLDLKVFKVKTYTSFNEVELKIEILSFHNTAMAVQLEQEVAVKVL
jgi:ASC-1-like (ASCH) protein